MRQCKIDILLTEINTARGLTYPSIGYLYYADIMCDGIKRPRTVWQIISEVGGVSKAHQLGGTIHKTIAALQALLNDLRGLK